MIETGDFVPFAEIALDLKIVDRMHLIRQAGASGQQERYPKY
jgi:hypothetical protein